MNANANQQNRTSVMGSLGALPRLEAVSRQYFHCLWSWSWRLLSWSWSWSWSCPYCLVLVLPLLSCTLLSWSYASSPIQFKTPVEKRQ